MPLDLTEAQRTAALNALSRHSEQTVREIVRDLEGMRPMLCGGKHEMPGRQTPAQYCRDREKNMSCLHVNHAGKGVSAAKRIRDYLRLAKKVANAAGITLDPVLQQAIADEFNDAPHALYQLDVKAQRVYGTETDPRSPSLAANARMLMAEQLEAAQPIINAHMHVLAFFKALEGRERSVQPETSGSTVLPDGSADVQLIQLGTISRTRVE